MIHCQVAFIYFQRAFWNLSGSLFVGRLVYCCPGAVTLAVVTLWGNYVDGGDGGDDVDGGNGGHGGDVGDDVHGRDDVHGGDGGDDVDDKNVHFIPSSSLHCTVLAQYSARIFKYFARALSSRSPQLYAILTQDWMIYLHGEYLNILTSIFGYFCAN